MRYSEINIQAARFSYVAAFAVVVLVFSVTRGLVPILTKDASLAQPTYYTAALLGILLSCYGLYAVLFTNSRAIEKLPRRLLVVNILFFLIWAVPVLIFRPELGANISIIYLGLFPFSVYALIKIPEKTLHIALSLITVIVAVFVIIEFIELNTSLIANGYSYAFEQQTLLRPGVFQAFSKSGGLFRPNGLFGSLPEDSGNILAILFVYWFAMLFRGGHHKLLLSFITIVTLVALLCTSTASNIIASFVGTIFVFAAILKNKRLHDYFFSLVVFFIALIILWWGLSQYNGGVEMLWRWVGRASIEHGDWENMLDIRSGNWSSDMFAVLFGHGGSLNISRMGTMEIGIGRIFFEYGLFHSLVIFSFLLYPVTLFFFRFREERDCRTHVLPYVAAVGVGVLSMWHYISVMQTTNIFVFFALYAQALRIFHGFSRTHVRRNN